MKKEFLLLAKKIQPGLAGATPEDGIAVINLNLRSVVTEPEEVQSLILERLFARMTQQEYWQTCEKL